MTVTRLTIAPEYLGFYLAGASKVEIPQFSGRLGIISNPNCIRVPALYREDGNTSVTIGSFEEVGSPDTPDFDGPLNTPSGVMHLFDANDDIDSVATETLQVRVRIWINLPTEPDQVRMALGE